MERAGGNPEQSALPGFEDVSTPAERVFSRLARQWHESFAVVEPASAPPRALDELALAALLLARESGAVFTTVAWQQVEANIVLADQRAVTWMDRMPWQLASRARLMGSGRRTQIEDFDGRLNHHNSALRTWTLEVAWMVRPWLERESTLPLLLENVAGTLVGVEMSWGLAGALFDSAEHFYAAADSWQPSDFADQYTARMGVFRKRGLLATQAYFWRVEATCRHIIATEAMTLDGATRDEVGRT